MTAQWMRLRADLRTGWRGTVSLVVVLAIGGGLSLAALAGARRTDSAYDRFLVASSASDVVTAGGATTVTGVGSVDEDAVRAQPQVIRLEANDAYLVSVRAGTNTIVQPGEWALSIHDGPQTLDRLQVTEGRLPRPGAAEIVVGFEVARRARARVGDPVTIRYLSQEDLTPSTFEAPAPAPAPVLTVQATLVGFVAFPGAFPPEPSYMQVFGTPAVAPSDPGLPLLRIMKLRLARGDADLSAVKAAFDRVAGGSEVFVSRREVRAAVERSIGVQVSALWIFALIAGGSALLVAVQTLGRHLAVAAEDHPVLHAVGMTRSQLATASLLRAVAVTVSGTAGALGIALALSPLTPIGVARIAEPNPGLAFDALALGGGAGIMAAVLLGLSVPVALALARSRARPSSALAPTIGLSRIAETMSRAGWRPPAVIGVRFALDPGRGPTATPVRSAIASTAAAIAALVASLVFASSLTHLLDTPALSGWNWSAVYGNPFVPGAAPLVAGALDASPAVAEYSTGSLLIRVHVANRGRGRDASAYAIDEARGSVYPTVAEGRWPSRVDEIALGASVMRDVGASLGDVLAVGIGDRSASMRVVGRAVFPAMNNDTIGELGQAVGMTLEALRRLAPDAPADFFFTRYRPDADPAAIRALTGSGPGRFIWLEGPLRPSDLEDVARVRSLPGVLAGLLALLVLATLAHALATSARRRRRDLAILKSVGFAKRELGSAVRWQGLALVAASLALGVPAGVVAGRWGWRVYADRLGVVPSARTALLGLTGLAVAALVVAVAASFPPGRAAARTSVATALRLPD